MEEHNYMIDTVKILPKGQITLPKDFRTAMRLDVGDKLSIVYNNGTLVLMNPLIAAMRAIQDEFRKLPNDFKTEEEAMQFAIDVRKGKK